MYLLSQRQYIPVEGWIIRALDQLEDLGHLLDTLTGELLMNRVQVSSTFCPEIDLCQRPWVCVGLLQDRGHSDA